MLFCREVVILMEATEDGEMELLLSYVVNKAKWSPCYDIRVFSGDSRMKVRDNFFVSNINIKY
jgi:hypothetical protein